MERLPVDKLVIPQGLLPRVLTGTVEEKVREYAELIASGVEFDPILVWDRGGEYWVVDGVHRLTAYKRAGKSEVPVRFVSVADEVEFRLLAISANAKHGLPLKREEKQLLAQTLYKLGVSIKRIAQALGVSERAVYSWTAKVREEQEMEFREQVRRLMQEGRSVKEIARQTGKGVGSVVRAVKEEVEEESDPQAYERGKALVWDEFLRNPEVDVYKLLKEKADQSFADEWYRKFSNRFYQEVGAFFNPFEEEEEQDVSKYESELREVLQRIVSKLGVKTAKSLCEKVFKEVFSNE